MHKKGFTLVELSIVLVIIGLVIGGLLSARSMIGTAKNLNFVRDMAQYEAAVHLFRKNFKTFPGDASYVIPAGDNDEILSDVEGCKGRYSAKETDHVFAHLSTSGMIDEKYQPYSPKSCNGDHANDRADSSLKGKISPFTELSSDAGAVIGTRTPPIMAGKPEPGSSGFFFRFYMNALDAVSLSKKLPIRTPVFVCYDKANMVILCSDPSAVLADVTYTLGGR